jgi:hypothetical protein
MEWMVIFYHELFFYKTEKGEDFNPPDFAINDGQKGSSRGKFRLVDQMLKIFYSLIKPHGGENLDIIISMSYRKKVGQ